MASRCMAEQVASSDFRDRPPDVWNVASPQVRTIFSDSDTNPHLASVAGRMEAKRQWLSEPASVASDTDCIDPVRRTSESAGAGSQPGHRFPEPRGSTRTRTDTEAWQLEFRRTSAEPAGHRGDTPPIRFGTVPAWFSYLSGRRCDSCLQNSGKIVPNE